MLKPSIISYLETEILHLKIGKIHSLNRGGTSKNYRLVLKDCSYLLKVFPHNDHSILRAERLLSIDRFLSQSPSIETPHFLENKFFTFENHIFLLANFIEGKHISLSNLSIDTLSSFVQSEQNLASQAPKKDTFLYQIIKPEELFFKAQARIEELKKQKYSFFGFIAPFVSSHLKKIYTQTKIPFSDPVIIHADTKPDNFILRDNRLVMLDFEMIRLGYTVEDLAQFVLSLVLQRSVWCWNKKAFSRYFSFFTKAFNLKKEDWIYGVNMYFLRLMNRRLTSSSLFLSPRKSWLFINHLNKQQKIIKFIESFYLGSSGK